MVLNSLDAVGKAVKNSSYKVLTRTNHIKDEDGGDLLQWSDVASVKDVFALEGIDFVGIDAYKQKVSELEVSTSAGGGAVKVTATGDMRITSLTIDPAAVDPDDVEMLQDLILAAVNDALESAGEAANQQVSSVTGGLGIPGLF